ncbi:hypothetical protein GUK36_36640 [Rhizobium leguminosarum]|uniref:Uncharacterized protein n=1 Tax=Rhizobium leguminosarum TaxID=384 RepID=A0A6P0DT04_RHILE|nr:hypothetical protein [Rhizobium leguminosarum]
MKQPRVQARTGDDIGSRPFRDCAQLLYRANGNHFRPHSSLGYQTPPGYAGIIVAAG